MLTPTPSLPCQVPTHVPPLRFVLSTAMQDVRACAARYRQRPSQRQGRATVRRGRSIKAFRRRRIPARITRCLPESKAQAQNLVRHGNFRGGVSVQMSPRRAETVTVTLVGRTQVAIMSPAACVNPMFGTTGYCGLLMPMPTVTGRHGRLGMSAAFGSQRCGT